MEGSLQEKHVQEVLFDRGMEKREVRKRDSGTNDNVRGTGTSLLRAGEQDRKLEGTLGRYELGEKQCRKGGYRVKGSKIMRDRKTSLGGGDIGDFGNMPPLRSQMEEEEGSLGNRGGKIGKDDEPQVRRKKRDVVKSC